jgi:ribosomal protein S18 acetylase RimI-like enzyme
MKMLQILKATEEDIPAINTLVHSCYRGEESFQGWTSEAKLLGGHRTTPDRLKREMNTPGSQILKGLDNNGEVIACVLAEKDATKMHVGMLCVQPTLQGAGIGKQMMAAVADLARSENCTALQIHVLTARESLVGWYERHGFHKTGETEPFPEATHEFGIPRQPLEFYILEKPVV